MISTNSRIAKNTVYLYVRMILFLLIKLYTARVALVILGLDDYGIYNLVAGVVVMFTFLNSALSQTTQRFLNIAIGKSDEESFIAYFINAVNSHILIGLMTSALAGVIGWFIIKYKLNIPAGREDTAMIVFLLSLFSNFFSILRMPYNAVIISYERMSFYAFIGIVEVILNLGVIYLLPVINMDKLCLYAILMCIISIIMLVIHVVYCSFHYPVTKFHISISFPIIREILSFSFLSTLSSFANIITKQGQNIILNIFNGVSINAATAITTQVTTAVFSFITNFQIAANPQLMKSFAAKDWEYLRNLFFTTSKMSFYLFLFLLIPVVFCIDELLQLWLETVPEFTSSFCILTFVCLLINTLGGPVWTTIQASGEIKKYQLTIFVTTILNLPIYYLLLYWGFSPVSTFYFQILTNVLILIQGLKIALPNISSSWKSYTREVILPIAKVCGFSLFIPLLCFGQLRETLDLWTFLISVFFISAILSSLCIYLAGLTKNERKFVYKKLKKLAQKKNCI